MSRSTKKPVLEAPAIWRGIQAGFLAWLFPGAGHLFLKARLRAGVFAGLVLVAVVLGCAFDGNLPVIDGATPFLSRLQVGASLALGPMEPVMRQVFYGRVVLQGDDGRAILEADDIPALKIRRERSFRTWNSYGSLYLMAAGLMNLLLILDAWDIAIGRKE